MAVTLVFRNIRICMQGIGWKIQSSFQHKKVTNTLFYFSPNLSLIFLPIFPQIFCNCFAIFFNVFLFLICLGENLFLSGQKIYRCSGYSLLFLSHPKTWDDHPPEADDPFVYCSKRVQMFQFSKFSNFLEIFWNNFFFETFLTSFFPF